MEQRVELIREYNDGERIVSLAEHYGVSQKTIYKWIERYAIQRIAGLEDRSRVPHTSPQQLSEETILRVIEARQRWGWGPQVDRQTRTGGARHDGTGGEHDRGVAAQQRSESSAQAPCADAAMQRADHRGRGGHSNLVRRF